jgi:hypothetical protein
VSTLLSIFAGVASAAYRSKPPPPKKFYDNYSFDYSAHKLPIAYTAMGNTVE